MKLFYYKNDTDSETDYSSTDLLSHKSLSSVKSEIELDNERKETLSEPIYSVSKLEQK